MIYPNKINTKAQNCSNKYDVIILQPKEHDTKTGSSPYPKATLALDVHDGKNRLVQDGIADILGRLGVGSHLRENVVHGLGGVAVLMPKDP